MRRLLALIGLAACACVSQTETLRSPPILPATGSAAAGREAIELPETATPEAAEEPEPERDSFAWWDRDGDGVLREQELTETWIARFDRDGDGVLARSEWPSP